MLTRVAGSPVEAEVPRERRLEDLLRLGELCIEVLQQNEEHHAEVTPHWSNPTNNRTAGPTSEAGSVLGYCSECRMFVNYGMK